MSGASVYGGLYWWVARPDTGFNGVGCMVWCVWVGFVSVQGALQGVTGYQTDNDRNHWVVLRSQESMTAEDVLWIVESLNTFK